MGCRLARNSSARCSMMRSCCERHARMRRCIRSPDRRCAPRRMQTILTIDTNGPGLYEFTDEVRHFVALRGESEGLLTLFVQHTSCSLCVQENADPDVRRDLEEFFQRLVPPSGKPPMDWVRHTIEGSDDMPAHIKAALTAVSLSSPVSNS